MRQISLWAKRHKGISRMIIVGIYLLLNVLGIYTGNLLKDIGIFMSESYFNIAIIACLVICFHYPSKRNRRDGHGKDALYRRRKFYDFSLGAITFFMIIFLTNNNGQILLKSNIAVASFINSHGRDTCVYDNILIKSFVSNIQRMDVSKLSQREKIRILKKQIKTIKQDKTTSRGDKIALIVLSIVIALALLFFLSALACNIACAGSEALSIIILIAGTFLIVFFLVKIIKRIRHPRNETKDAAVSP